jgi:hypothetical protein
MNEYIENAALTDRPMSALDEHVRSLDSALNGLERVQLQLDNLLSKLRSPQPRVSGSDTTKVPHQPEAVMARLSQSDNRLSEICQELNNQVDELGNII